jgi:hypothetical protein
MGRSWLVDIGRKEVSSQISRIVSALLFIIESRVTTRVSARLCNRFDV